MTLSAVKTACALCLLLVAALPAQAQPFNRFELRVQPYSDGPASALHVNRAAMQEVRLTIPLAARIDLFAGVAYADVNSTLFSMGGVRVRQTLAPRVNARLDATLASGNASNNFARQHTIFEGGAGVGYALQAGPFQVEPGATFRFDHVRSYAWYGAQRAEGTREDGWLGAEVRLGLPLGRWARVEAAPGVLVGTRYAGALRGFGSLSLVAGF